ncbi:MAG: SOS response-associated peptidase [Candidatus Edwardsbacteria bacterium]|nr:SOS response-associated peptidase [Candidatus Edwardsbacteria bacterium]
MCGRFVRKSGGEEIAREFDIELSDISFLLEPSYNIAPGNQVAAVVKRDRLSVEAFRWGLIPPWAGNEKTGYEMINARAETLGVKAGFKKPFQSQRCLIIADGFYEWRGRGRPKVPYYFHRKDPAPMGLAGLFGSWSGPGGLVVNSCAIITTAANQLMQPVHDRMPAVIAREDYRLWLDNGISDPKALGALLRPYPPEDMECYPVSPLVNSPRNDSIQCIQPVQ